MAFRLVSSGGAVTDPAVLNMAASGVVKNGSVVEFSRTGGLGVYPASSSTTTTNIFGVALDYAQGASDVQVPVIKFTDGQVWEADCTDIATTAQIGLRHVLNDHLTVRNTATDKGAGNAHSAVFWAIGLTSGSTGSGKLLGFFRRQDAPVPTTNTTFI